MRAFETSLALVNLVNVCCQVDLKSSGVGCVESGETITAPATLMEKMKKRKKSVMVMDM